MAIISGSIKTPTDGIQTGIIPGDTTPINTTPIVKYQSAPVNQTSTNKTVTKV